MDPMTTITSKIGMPQRREREEIVRATSYGLTLRSAKAYQQMLQNIS